MAQEQRASGAAAEHRRSRAPRRRSAGEKGLGATGVRLDRGLVQKSERGMRNPLGSRAGIARLYVSGATAVADPRRGVRRRAVFQPRVGSRCLHS